MTFEATKEQQAILDAELVPIKVIACAGSGKTATAVRRLVEVRRRMSASKGFAVLLSYSNVAVDTFRTEYAAVSSQYENLSDRVLICTVDSFIANNILAAHAAQVMNCTCRPFLVHGRERFLENSTYSVFDGTRPVSIVDVEVRSAGAGQWEFVNSVTDVVLPDARAIAAVAALGKTGAYTHALGRLWAMIALEKVERLPQILARRYPHILVDEAQDIGSLHGRTLALLEEAGSVLALVGDPNQAIYEFADADGSFLRDFEVLPHGLDQPITENRRSVSQVVAASNGIAGTLSTPIREVPDRKHGAYFLRYESNQLANLITTFATLLDQNNYSRAEAAILARGTSLSYQLSGGRDAFGQGATKLFAEAVINRDVKGDIAVAFDRALDGTMRLLEVADNGLRTRIATGARDEVARSLRKLVWIFLRDDATGIPHGGLPGDQWHAELKKRLPALLAEIESRCGLVKRASWYMNVTTKAFGAHSLVQDGLISAKGHDIRVSTVHRAKGESIPAVLYVTNPQSLGSLLGGTVNEEGRIGYVAVTRAGDLLVLAIPGSTKQAKVEALNAKGFAEWVG
ncbi:superfamily I DNA/RNA helicase [Paraburkholderia sp. RAU6.4a]|uniref:UvrD-helicase domain-containing protein n=1 Tax=Paraburkholderia sp. RAU6.4a TaxID=2991067 RepID=UPI003D1C56CF